MKRIFIVSIILLSIPIIVYAQDYTSPSYTLSGAKVVIAGGSASSASYSLGCVEIGNITGSIAESATYTLDAGIGNQKALFDPPLISITNPSDGTISYEGPITLNWIVDGAPFTGEKDIALELNTLTITDSNGPHTSRKSVEVYGVRTPPALPE